MASPSREIAWPFRIGPTGGVEAVEDPYVAAAQRLRHLILTNPGERLMVPAYGTPAQQFLFENNNEVVAAELVLRLRAALGQWEPNIVVNQIVPIVSEYTGELSLTVHFTVPPRESTFTTVVSMGGTVTGGISS